MTSSNTIKKLKSQINDKIVDFDLLALVRLLEHKGFDQEKIYFQSNDTRVSPDRFIQSVDISDRHVIVTLNMGFLGAQAPIPEYFSQKIESKNIKRTNFVTFLRYFDHLILANFLNNLHPEINKNFYPDLPNTIKNYVRSQNVFSKTFLCWLLNMVFPEFLNTVEPVKDHMRIKTTDRVLGKIILSQKSGLGDAFEVPFTKIRITLSQTEQLDFFSYKNIVAEVKKRLCEFIFPVIFGGKFFFQIILKSFGNKTVMKLKDDSLLGFQSLGDDQEKMINLVIYQGYIRKQDVV